MDIEREADGRREVVTNGRFFVKDAKYIHSGSPLIMSLPTCSLIFSTFLLDFIRKYLHSR